MLHDFTQLRCESAQCQSIASHMGKLEWLPGPKGRNTPSRHQPQIFWSQTLNTSIRP